MLATLIEETLKWIDQVVIGCNFCPFAAKEFRSGSIYFHTVEGQQKATLRQAFLEQCQWLDQHPETSTSFLLCPGLNKFEAYLGFVARAERLIVQSGYESVYQVASFHPEYCFSGSNQRDPANYTNRSPFPMLHLLREDSLERAIAIHPDAEGIPERNMLFARAKGLQFMQSLARGSRSSAPAGQ